MTNLLWLLVMLPQLWAPHSNNGFVSEETRELLGRMVPIDCVFLLFVFCLFCLVLPFLCLLFVLHGDSSMDYVSIQSSSLLSHIVIITNVSIALIR